MSALRQRLTSPHFWLALLLLLGLLVVADAARTPSRQLAVHGWSAAVRGYRSLLKPLLPAVARCRFAPSCSHYSEQAVRRFGIARGLSLTVGRLARCTAERPLGSLDPVPEP